LKWEASIPFPNDRPFTKFDRDFVGREALARTVKEGCPQRKKVSFEWNGEELAKIEIPYGGNLTASAARNSLHLGLITT
jgi:hypothetical protein